MNTLHKLKKFAKSREKAYQIANSMEAGKMKAISRINRVADFFAGKSEAAQLRAVAQVEQDILLILPDPRSRYAKLRQRMLDLIQQSRGL
ncbi:hypothetical protein [Cyclobacterium jeungdonense]|uniref:CHAD domain-containing protein n=1 Tax=Cyclobacterium jeungdonense TaxID=708087 RepID=A0ABT8CA89_9BACT|nr:hypothetical protein [Cyclobacterium jeungdonense]MDN3689062.1 hypothetical protein [Cyclobacterium jeungdonense]